MKKQLKKFSETFILSLRWGWAIILIVGVIILFIFLYKYLKGRDKTIVVEGGFKFVESKNNIDIDQNMLKESVRLSKDILKRMKLKRK